MAGDLFSASWYRVEHLKPRLRSHVRLHRHQYRGQIWHVLHDLATDQFHRFGPAAYFVIARMNGRNTIESIWQAAIAQLGDDAPTQDDIVRLLGQLHTADAIVADIQPDASELSRRALQQSRKTRLARYLNVFAWRFPLCDPDRFLTRFLPLVRPLIGRTSALIWLLVVGTAILSAGVHWADLTHDVLDHALAPGNLMLLWLLFPVLKLIHEMGHAFVTKAFGGEVHELGVMLMVFTPVPYVEASTAWAFRDKWQRVLVGAAGMVVELFVASLALWVWLNAEPGLVRLIAYNTILISGFSTIFFNANPLLRFDGYYMLMDFLEIPNLKARAGRYAGYLTERYLLGQHEAELPISTKGERAWFVFYGLLSAVYRVLVVVGILLFLGDRFPLVAVLFAGLTSATMIGLPLAKGVSFMLSSPRLRHVRGRAIGTTACLATAVVGLLGFVPVPFHTVAEGVVWLPEESFVRAGADGFIEQVVAQPGAPVNAGDVLVICRNPEISTQLEVLQARLKELEARRTEQEPTNRVQAAILEEEIAYVRQEHRRAQDRVGNLTVRSRRSGVFVVPTPQDLPGRFLHQGDLVAHVVEFQRTTVRTVVGQGDIDLIRQRLEQVEVRLAERLAEALPAALTRIVPAGTHELPSAALSSVGGGNMPMDPADPHGLTSMQRIFHVDLALSADTHVINAGGRVHVRFTHSRAPLSVQWTRQLRQLFLTRFNV